MTKVDVTRCVSSDHEHTFTKFKALSNDGNAHKTQWRAGMHRTQCKLKAVTASKKFCHHFECRSCLMQRRQNTYGIKLTEDKHVRNKRTCFARCSLTTSSSVPRTLQ